MIQLLKLYIGAVTYLISLVINYLFIYEVWNCSGLSRCIFSAQLLARHLLSLSINQVGLSTFIICRAPSPCSGTETSTFIK